MCLFGPEVTQKSHELLLARESDAVEASDLILLLGSRVSTNTTLWSVYMPATHEFQSTGERKQKRRQKEGVPFGTTLSTALGVGWEIAAPSLRPNTKELAPWTTASVLSFSRQPTRLLFRAEVSLSR